MWGLSSAYFPDENISEVDKSHPQIKAAYKTLSADWSRLLSRPRPKRGKAKKAETRQIRPKKEKKILSRVNRVPQKLKEIEDQHFRLDMKIINLLIKQKESKSERAIKKAENQMKALRTEIDHLNYKKERIKRSLKADRRSLNEVRRKLADDN